MIAAPARRLAALAVVAAVAVAACGGGATAAPASPPVAGTPADCPTSPPPPMAADATATVTLATAKGNIVIEVKGSLAPNAAGNFVALAECGFFDGVVFHRLVPGFVIQGGCPRGDGWGDAGYFLRSQFNARTYERGTVGMAHSGKDTPGSQFFIAQTAQPHLDGRYTIVGKVVKGLEIIDLIEIGDTFAIRVGS